MAGCSVPESFLYVAKTKRVLGIYWAFLGVLRYLYHCSPVGEGSVTLSGAAYTSSKGGWFIPWCHFPVEWRWIVRLCF